MTILDPNREALGELFKLLAIGPVLLEETYHFVDGELLRDWWQQLRIKLKRAEILDELGLLDEQHLWALRRHILKWREVFDRCVGDVA